MKKRKNWGDKRQSYLRAVFAGKNSIDLFLNLLDDREMQKLVFAEFFAGMGGFWRR